jgi:hypothetical protein
LNRSQKLGNPINWVYVEVFCSSDVQKLIVDPETESRKILPLSPSEICKEKSLEDEAQQCPLFEDEDEFLRSEDDYRLFFPSKHDRF